MRRSHTARTGALLLGGAGLLLVSGCSSSSASGSSEANAAAGSTDRQAYVQCLSEHGVTLPSRAAGEGPGGEGGGAPGGQMPDGEAPGGMPTDLPSGMPTDRPSGMPSGAPTGGPNGGGGPGGGGMRAPDGVDSDTWQAAQEACATLAPTGGFGNRGQASPGVGDGTGSTSTPSPSASGSTGSGTSTYTVFWQCMSDHGVSAPASGDPADLAATATIKAARKICDALLPS